MHPGRPVQKLTAVIFALTIIPEIAMAHPGSGIAVDRVGAVFFVDTGSGLWKIDAAGKVTKVPGPAYHWMALDAKNDFARSRLPKLPDSDMVAAGSNPTILLSSDFPIVVGTDGDLYYPHKQRGKPLQLMRMTPSGRTTAVVDIPPSKKGPLEWIAGLAVGTDGTIYYTEDHAVWRIVKGQASIVATIQTPSDATLVPMHTKEMGPMLRGLAVDSKGVIYVAASAEGRVVKVTPDGKSSTLLQVESPWSPTAVAVHGSDVYVQEYLHTTGDDRKQWLPRVRKIASDGKSTVIATVEQMPGAR